ncbi:hypothetical protein M9H77_23046 [Catharanthus roseus]|uniref:Uncharacterized protein n=1 Tax=Catharanthus roseus TaxID=4058 RepID=A0ACC0AUW6_CATRO|nr:hypothetical protein M9H77_23046 [Catharanthus roseus]
MKEHFVEPLASLGKIPNKIKNIWYTKFKVRADGYQPESMTSVQYTSLFDWEVAQRSRLQGRGGQRPRKHTGGSRSFIEWLKLKANAERLHIETGSSIPTDEQLMFEATDGSNKGNVNGFGSQSSAINVER